MHGLRHALLAIISLSLAAASIASADEPEPGKVRLLRTLKEPSGRVFTLSFSADGRRLVTAGGKVIRLWDTATGKEIIKYELENAYPGEAVFSPDGRVLAAMVHRLDDNSVNQDELVLFDADSQKPIKRIPQPKLVRWFVFAPDGKTLVAASDDRAAHLWDAATGKEIRRMPYLGADGHEWVASTLPGSWDQGTSDYGAFSPDGKTVALGLGDGSVWLYDAATGTARKRLFHVVAGAKHMAFTPDGKLLAAGSRFQDVIQIWDPNSGELVREVRVRSGGLSFSADGKTLAVCCAVECVLLLEVATGQARHKFACKNLFTAKVAPVGHLLATTDLKGSVQLWDWRDPCLEYPAHLEGADVERLWTDLAGDDAAVAYKAVAALIAAPEQGVAALFQRLKPLAPVTAAEINRLVGGLDDDDFLVRDAASQRLKELGEVGRTALQRALANEPTPELKHQCELLLARPNTQPAPETLRRLRAVEVLETVGTEEAKRALQKLADGAAGAVETEDARAALKRLEKK